VARTVHALLAVAAAVLLSFLAGRAQAAATDDAMIGLWSSRTLAPALQGKLILVRRGTTWRATLRGRQQQVTADGRSIHFEFPGGGFRGALAGRDVRGFWLQSFGLGQGGDQRFASPLLLHRTAFGVWQGTVRPLKDSFTLFAKIDRDDKGQLTAAIRNPELNFTAGAGRYQVSRQDDELLFRVGPEGATPKLYLKATVLHAPKRLKMELPDLGLTLELARQPPTQAGDFFSRPPGDAPYLYRRPPKLNDGWDTARARATGMDEAVLQQLIRRLSGLDPTAGRAPLIHSLLVAHHGKLVLEEYFHGFGRDQPHDTRSASKTFVSVMLGAAMQDGVPISPASRVYSVMSGLGPFAHPDPRKADIDLAQLLTHSSGLACDDNDEESPGAEDAMQSQKGQPNWVKYALDLPIASEPGTRYAYCSAGINLAAGVLSAATRTWLPELFDRTIARPLQFGPYYWDLDPAGEGYGGGGAYLRSRDLLKLGQAYLDGGVWHGRRIVPAQWVKLSTAPHININPTTTGLNEQHFANAYFAGQDGYAWHLGTFRVGGIDYANYAATGNGGQLLIVVPALELAIVFTAGNYGQGGIWNRFRTQIVPDEIIPAINR